MFEVRSPEPGRYRDSFSREVLLLGQEEVLSELDYVHQRINRRVERLQPHEVGSDQKLSGLLKQRSRALQRLGYIQHCLSL